MIEQGGGTCTTWEVPNVEHEQLLEHARRALRQSPLASAAILGSDAFAPAMYRAAYEAGRSVPKGFSVVGFAGLELGRRLDPSLTSIAQDPEALGARATRMLYDRMASTGAQLPIRHEVLAPTLIIGSSTLRHAHG